MMAEKIFRFGETESLLGVLTEPERSAAVVPPAVLWLNAGMIHHVGPFGWYVTLARRFAELGFLSFRIDLSGVGESPHRNDKRPTQERAAADVVAAMDFLARKRHVERFILLGVCSGAIIAHRVAVQDSRVAGIVLLDGYAYRTLGYYARHYGRRLFRRLSWVSAARRLLRKFMPATAPPKPAPLYASAEFFLESPPQEQICRELANLLQRGVQSLFVYTGGIADMYFNHRRQFAEMFGNLDPAGTRLQVDYLDKADHLFSAHADRQLLFQRVETWLARFQ
jgi:pimeloyl-ACP methyl ester carboxylesterase